jgi:hypothetical protein
VWCEMSTSGQLAGPVATRFELWAWVQWWSGPPTQFAPMLVRTTSNWGVMTIRASTTDRRAHQRRAPPTVGRVRPTIGQSMSTGVELRWRSRGHRPGIRRVTSICRAYLDRGGRSRCR